MYSKTEKQFRDTLSHFNPSIITPAMHFELKQLRNIAATCQGTPPHPRWGGATTRPLPRRTISGHLLRTPSAYSPPAYPDTS